MKIIVFGASGLVGSYAAKRFAASGNRVVGVSASSSGMDFNIDCSDLDALSSLLEAEKPDVAFNAVKSNLSTDAAEEKKEETWRANVTVPENLARLQPKHGYLLFHLSSDWVYEGKEGETYTEESVTYPVNFYAYTKAIAEEKVRLLSKKHIIARTTGVFGHDPRGRDFFSRFLSAKRDGKELPASDDQFSQPIYAGELARIAEFLIGGGCRGIYNCVGPDYVSRYELAKIFEGEFGQARISPVKSSSRKMRVPTNLRLDIGKLGSICKVEPLASQVASLKKEAIA